MGDLLHFGDQITLYCEPSALSGMGYVCALTTHSTKCLVKYSDRHDPPIRNISACLFEVLSPPVQSNVRKEGAAEDAEKDDDDGEKSKEESDHSRQYGRPLQYGQYIQLRNVMMGKYLRAKSSKTAILDHTNMASELASATSKNCTFRVLPRYRVRAEGEPVRTNDQIVLESFVGKNYLHVSARRFDDSYIESGHNEVDLSVVRSAFIIRLYSPYPASVPSEALMVGSVVRMYYKEREAYLCAEGSSEPAVISENVHMRVRSPLKPHLPNAPSYFFRIELAEDSMSGGVLKWTSLVRIRHLPTMALVAVSDVDGQAFLTQDAKDPAAVFRLLSDLEDEFYVKRDSFVTLFNVLTGKCLRCHESKRYQKNVYRNFYEDPDGGITNLKWDDAVLYQTALAKTTSAESAYAFELSVVGTPVKNMFHILGVQPIIAFFKRKLIQGTLTARHSQVMIAEMRSLRNFMIVNDDGCKEHQKIIRHLMVVDDLVALLRKLQETPEPEGREGEFKRVSGAIYLVIDAYVMGKSPKNELYIARHFKQFLGQVPEKVHAEDMLVNLVEDNYTLLSNLSQQQVTLFLKQLNESPSPQYLDFLRILCICDNHPLSENQILVTRELLAKNKSTVLCKTYVEPDPQSRARPQEKMVVVLLPNGRRVNLLELSKALSNPDDSEEEMVHYAELLEKQLELFAVLCAGRNMESIKAITTQIDFVDFEEAFLCLSMNALHPRLRAAYAQVLLHTYVDVDPMVPDMETIDINFPWKKLTNEVDKDADADDTLASTGVAWEHFPVLKNFIFQYLQHSSVVEVANADQNRLTSVVLNIARYCAIFGYYTSPANVAALVQVTTNVLHWRNDTENSKVLTEEDLGKSRSEAYDTVKIDAIKLLEILANLRLRRRMFLVMTLFKDKKGRLIYDRLRGGGSGHELTNVGSLREDINAILRICNETDQLNASGDLSIILRDLSMFNNERLQLHALHLLDRQHSSMQEILSHASQSSLLIDENISRQHEETLSRKRLARFRLSINKEMTPAEQEEVLQYLHRLTTLCTLSGVYQESPDTDVLEPHRAHQNMLYNAGILEDLFTLFQSSINPLSPEQELMPDVMAAGFNLLRVLMMENNPIQKRVFDRVDILLTLPEYRVPPHECGEEAEAKFAEVQAAKGAALAEVFTSARELCLQVKESTIEHILEYTAEQHVKPPAMLGILDAIIMIEELNLPLKRNQAFIMKYLPKNRDALFVLCTDHAVRMQLLRKGDLRDPRLAFHIAIVDLFATMCMGENRSVESMCQTIFTINQVLDVLVDPAISVVCKIPYLRFLVWVYMNSAAGKSESGTSGLQQRPEVWQILENLILPYLKDRVAGVDFEVAYLVRKAFDATTLRHIFAAIVPFVQVFYQQYFDISAAKPSQVLLTSQIAGALTRHLVALPFLVRDDLQGPILYALAKDLAIRIQERQMLQAIEMRLQADVAKGYVGRSRMRVRYEQEFSVHNEMNDVLHVWVNKLQASYQLPYKPRDGTEKTGVGVPYNPEFNELMTQFVNLDSHHTYSRHEPLHIVSLDAQPLVTQFRLGLAVSSEAETTENDKRSYEALCIKALRLLRAMLRHEKRRIDFIPSDNLVKHRPKVLAEMARLQDDMVNIGMLKAVMDAFRYDNTRVQRECFEFLIDLYENSNKKIQTYFNENYRAMHGEWLFSNMRSRLTLATNSVKERKMIENVVSNQKVKTIDAETLDEIIRFKDDVGSKLVLRFLDHLCSGEHTANQALAREQPGRFSVNLLAECLSFLSALQRNTESESVKMLIVVLRTLPQLIQGNLENMRAVIDLKILDPLNHLLHIENTSTVIEADQLLSLKRACARTLLVMLEYTNSVTQKIAKQIAEQVDIRQMHENLNHYWDLGNSKTTPEGKTKTKSLDLARMFYTILMRMADLDKRGRSFDPIAAWGDQTPEVKTARFWECGESMASVEIMREDELQRVHFPLPDKLAIRPEIKEAINYGVEREQGPIGKVRSFVELASLHIYMLVKRRRLLQHPLTAFVVSRSNFWRHSSLIVTSILNILMLSVYVGQESYTEYVPDRPTWCQGLIYFFGVVHVILSIFLVTDYFLTDVRTKEIVTIFSARAVDHSQEYFHEKLLRIIRKYTPSGISLYHIVYLLLSILGLPLYGYTYCFHLLHFAVHSESLSPVFTAVILAREQLQWVALLLLFIMYNFTLFSFAFFRRSFDAREGYYCYNMLECFLTVTSHGLRNGGGIGDVLTYTHVDPNEASYRVPFDLLFWATITVVGLNIVFTVIVGNFAQLREQRAELDEDLKRSCLICSKESYDFEMYAKGFKAHKTHEHNPFHYMSFFMYLQDKDPDEYTSHEDSVVRSLRVNDMGFFPLGLALSLQSRSEEETERPMAASEHLVDDMLSRIDKRQREKLAADDLKRTREKELTLQTQGRVV